MGANKRGDDTALWSGSCEREEEGRAAGSTQSACMEWDGARLGGRSEQKEVEGRREIGDVEGGRVVGVGCVACDKYDKPAS